MMNKQQYASQLQGSSQLQGRTDMSGRVKTGPYASVPASLLAGTDFPSNKDHANDRRDTRRSAFDIQVGVASAHRLFVGLVANISAGGLFIATEEALKKGDRVDVRFSIPGSDHVFHKNATVCWTRPFDAGEDNRARAGAGVQLDNLTEEEAKILNAFLQVHDSIFYDL